MAFSSDPRSALQALPLSLPAQPRVSDRIDPIGSGIAPAVARSRR